MDPSQSKGEVDEGKSRKVKKEKAKREKEKMVRVKEKKETPKSRATILQRPKMDAIKDNNVLGIIED